MLLGAITAVVGLSFAGGFVAGRAYGIELVIARITRAFAEC
jgi:hypothetical protein